MADWKFAVIKEPDDIHAKRLWTAVQGAPALDLGGMEMLAKRARSAPSRPGPARRVYKVGGRTLRVRPFAGARKGTQRKAVDLAKRRQAARALVELSWSWAPQAGLAKGCTDTRSETSLRRFQRYCERLEHSFEAKVLLDAARVWHELRSWCEAEAIQTEAWPLDPMVIEDFLELFRGKGRSVPRAKHNALVFLEMHVQAPLCTTGVHVPLPAKQKKAARGQAVPLQPLMVRSVRQAFCRTWPRDLGEG